jgi:hypothetical protein
MRFHRLSLAVMMGCMVAAPLAFAQNDTTNNSMKAAPADKTTKTAQKQHTAGVPEGLTQDQGTAMKQHTAGVPAGLLPDQGTAYQGSASKNQ